MSSDHTSQPCNGCGITVLVHIDGPDRDSCEPCYDRCGPCSAKLCLACNPPDEPVCQYCNGAFCARCVL